MKPIIKRYIFKSGDDIPEWLWRVKFYSHSGKARSRNYTLKFANTCIVSRVMNQDVFGTVNSLITITGKAHENGGSNIVLKNLQDVTIGNRAPNTGWIMYQDQVEGGKAWKEYLSQRGYEL